MTQSPASAPPATDILDLARTVAAGLVLAMAIQTVALQPYTIPSSSMEPGLVTGDYVVASKFPYGWSRASLPFDPPLSSGRLFGREPKRGDVVLFRLPRDRQQVWVKRLIGLPGDSVQVRGGTVLVNGRAVVQTATGMVQDHDDPARRVQLVRETLPDGRTWLTYDGGPGSPGDDTEVFSVPAGHYLMMGDNRDNSLDGRFPGDIGVGLLPAENIVGRAELVVASWRPGAGLFKPWTWLDLQPGRFFKPVR
ncbi:signal peptidase I [Brevundimonas sp. Root1423]|uniref:signal peptidase I n=1 Tax=Brevundimonas sp. Root1423 TaxID=1736462 RepID=UPI0006F37EDD|nr:signal peptidase I [Brevundimonas sp. Root1423]KQY80530.1 S26 family signal peptidase [Brevundimonas sp. Root1423]